VAATTGAVALEAGRAAGLTGAGNGEEVLDPAGDADRVRVAAAAGEATGLVAAGFGAVAVAVGDAWPSGDAVD